MTSNKNLARNTATKNRDKVAEMLAGIDGWNADPDGVADNLADDGLIAPDLPKPHNYGYPEGSAMWDAGYDRILKARAGIPIVRISDLDFPAQDVRRYALFLLAAADWAEQDK
ncbi:hypothetical protein [Corynebacterium cystitidis]|uniref:hypothetical protein n=1 Tax=Corynebacterium cystitidis TaxID=35757 RepID=UPI00211E10FC|nr:hypothetical protein [Corynebacterium cystitidis]